MVTTTDSLVSFTVESTNVVTADGPGEYTIFEEKSPQSGLEPFNFSILSRIFRAEPAILEEEHGKLERTKGNPPSAVLRQHDHECVGSLSMPLLRGVRWENGSRKIVHLTFLDYDFEKTLESTFRSKGPRTLRRAFFKLHDKETGAIDVPIEIISERYSDDSERNKRVTVNVIPSDDPAINEQCYWPIRVDLSLTQSPESLTNANTNTNINSTPSPATPSASGTLTVISKGRANVQNTKGCPYFSELIFLAYLIQREEARDDVLHFVTYD